MSDHSVFTLIAFGCDRLNGPDRAPGDACPVIVGAWSPSMRKPRKQKKPLNDLSRSLTLFQPNQTLTTVVELSKENWLVAGIIPGVERQPLYDGGVLANEGLALAVEQLKPAFLGWLRGEREHCKMCVIPTFAEEDAKRPHGVEAVGLCAPVVPRYRHARGMNHIGLDTACSQPAGQPKAVPAGLEGDPSYDRSCARPSPPLLAIARAVLRVRSRRRRASSADGAIACLIICRWTRCHRRSPHSIWIYPDANRP
jgi:hypothetical protein